MIHSFNSSSVFLWLIFKELIKIFIFCQKVGEPRKPVKKLSGVYIKKEAKMFFVPNFGQTCANPFAGQVVSLYDPTSFPKYLVPSRFKKLKELAGYNIGFMKYFSQYYDFIYKAELVGGGRFFYQNNTFSPGRFDGVNMHYNSLLCGRKFQ